MPLPKPRRLGMPYKCTVVESSMNLDFDLIIPDKDKRPGIMAELTICPWCGNPPKIMQSETGAWYAVSTCSKPECGHHTASSYATKQGSVEAWNAIMETRKDNHGKAN